MAKSDAELREPIQKSIGAVEGENDDASPVRREIPGNGRKDGAVYVDWEGNRKPIKKWLGIW